MIRRRRVVLIAAWASLLAAIAFAAPAHAAPVLGAPNIGENIGGLIKGLAGPIVFSFGGLTALGAFMRRDVGLAFTAVIITTILGLFVTDPGQDALEGVSNILAGALDSGD